jgi:thymidylate synthase
MPYHIIVAFSHKLKEGKGFGIGKANQLPWSIPEDLAHFQKVTSGGIVVMGRRTWESIPEKRKPLKDRFTIVVTSEAANYNPLDNMAFLTLEEVNTYLEDRVSTRDVFIAGGSELYKHFISKTDMIHATIVEKDVDCDAFFDIEHFEDFELDGYSDKYWANGEQCNYRHITYVRTKKRHEEHNYLQVFRDIIQKGTKRIDRTGVGTIGTFGCQMRFDISYSIPVLTTKYVAWKSVIKELLFFMKGQTNSKQLESEGVSIWKANTTSEFLANRGLYDYKEGDMGPMYGWLWRHMGAEYRGCDIDYGQAGFDQLQQLISDLKSDPFSRRHLLTTFHPPSVAQSVLMPCHGIAVQFYVEEVAGEKWLSCQMYQRSMDTFLGAPWNIESYAVLTHVLAKICDMRPKELIITTGDTHIYNNHIEQVKLQLCRKPLPFPVLIVRESVKEKPIDEITIDDFDIVGYLHHPSIKAPMAI